MHSEPVVKPLYADAGSGIIFNLSGELIIGDEVLPEGVIMLQVKHRAEDIVMAPGAQLTGIRFHPAIGYGILGRNYEKPTLLKQEQDQLYNLYEIFADLLNTNNNESRINALCLWAENHFDFTNVIPEYLNKALEFAGTGEALGKLNESTPMSQRQIERHFQSWLGMTPKHYQRVLRIKKTICYLRQHHDAKLADVAHQFGFSDQAHMTREFQAIAHITPGQV